MRRPAPDRRPYRPAARALLARFNIPTPVIGGLLVVLALLACRWWDFTRCGSTPLVALFCLRPLLWMMGRDYAAAMKMRISLTRPKNKNSKINMLGLP